MKKILGMVLLLFVLDSLPVQQTHALSCYWPPVDEAYEKYDAVVAAKVESNLEDGRDQRLDLQVITSYKGVRHTRIEAVQEGMWDIRQIGEDYLFYMVQTDEGWRIPLCAPVKRLDSAEEDLAYLEDKQIPFEPETKNTASSDSVNANSTPEPSSTSGMWLLLYAGGGILVVLAMVLAVRFRSGR